MFLQKSKNIGNFFCNFFSNCFGNLFDFFIFFLKIPSAIVYWKFLWKFSQKFFWKLQFWGLDFFLYFSAISFVHCFNQYFVKQFRIFLAFFSHSRNLFENCFSERFIIFFGNYNGNILEKYLLIILKSFSTITWEISLTIF